VAAGGLGCAKQPGATFEYAWDRDPAAKFEGLRTFAWIPDERVAVGDPRIDDAELERAVRQAVDRELTAKGYTPDSSGKPDFWVAYHASLRRRLDVRAMNSSYGPDPTRAWHPEHDEPQPGEYEAGTLVIDVIAPDGATLLWRGRVQTRIDPGRESDEVRRERLDNAVQGTLAPFPSAR
jgi:hypothetical protein